MTATMTERFSPAVWHSESPVPPETLSRSSSDSSQSAAAEGITIGTVSAPAASAPASFEAAPECRVQLLDLGFRHDESPLPGVVECGFRGPGSKALESSHLLSDTRSFSATRVRATRDLVESSSDSSQSAAAKGLTIGTVSAPAASAPASVGAASSDATRFSILGFRQCVESPSSWCVSNQWIGFRNRGSRAVPSLQSTEILTQQFPNPTSNGPAAGTGRKCTLRRQLPAWKVRAQ